MADRTATDPGHRWIKCSECDRTIIRCKCPGPVTGYEVCSDCSAAASPADRTIEDVLLGDWDHPPAIKAMLRVWDQTGVMDPLYAATAEHPVFSADGSLAVHRTDPELADQFEIRGRLNVASCRHAPHVVEARSGQCCGYRIVGEQELRAAALLAAPTTDPEEDGNE